MKIVLLDNGHGNNTKGKCSPDNRLKEWSYTRKIANIVAKGLEAAGVTAKILVPEDYDVSLSVRCRRVNDYCAKYGASNVCCVSIHCNAAGCDGKWHDANGWQVCISLNASSNSRNLANRLFLQAEKRGLKMRRPKPTQNWWQQNLAMCRDTNCPAILTENLFQDNVKDVDYLLSDKGMKDIADIHIEGILDYVKSL